MRNNWVLLFGFRLFNSVLIRTSFAPDEYFQCIEPAYNIAVLKSRPPVFSKTQNQLRSFQSLTWEWHPEFGLRTVFPVQLVSKFHNLLLRIEAKQLVPRDVLGFLHTKAARLISAIFSTIVDCSVPIIAHIIGGETEFNRHLASHAFGWSLVSYWAWYSGGRALANSWEAGFTSTAIALMHQNPMASWGYCCAAFSVVLRPSSIPFWCVVFVVQVRAIGWVKLIARAVVPMAAVLLFTAWLDGQWYGWNSTDTQWLGALHWPRYAPLQWLIFNLFQAKEAARLFGVHPWHWYFTSGVWAIAAPPLTCYLLMRPKNVRNWGWLAVFVYITTHSVQCLLCHGFHANQSLTQVVSHKEDRFLSPVLPLVSAYAAVATARRSPSAFPGTLVLLTIASLAVAVYLSWFHQAAPETTMHFLRNYILGQSKFTPTPQVLHVMAPCYSTPGAAFLHGTQLSGFLFECNPRFSSPNIPVSGHTCFNQSSRYVSASTCFEHFPYSFVSDLYQHVSLPYFAISWDSPSDIISEEVLFKAWMKENYSEIRREYHGHFHTFGKQYMVLWERKAL